MSNVYKALRALGTGDSNEHEYHLAVLDDENLSPKECADKIAEHFVAISKELEPINIDT